ncbi:hypothetical protein OTERR_17230 [Oryzomicrobium terrae]|uniref:Macro domain-containing protein n=1 Tax=Oryzomicrobium terrae TaxID=1735038 RepID=A0A5C1E993_9RHOO|nr:hypothetical protein OTERR_17230 [Oryzomicrobium terrae]
MGHPSPIRNSATSAPLRLWFFDTATMPASSPLATFLDGRVSIHVGDLTRHAVDALVNAANASLLGGGGVDGAIHRAGGPAILDACRAIRASRWPEGLPTGEAVLTTAGDLPARYVIHTVGPVYGQHGGREAELLANCYRNSLQLAADNALTSLAFPAISTGVYGYPPSEAAQVVSTTLTAVLATLPGMAEVRLVFFSPADGAIFLRHHRF